MCMSPDPDHTRYPISVLNNGERSLIIIEIQHSRSYGAEETMPKATQGTTVTVQ